MPMPSNIFSLKSKTNTADISNTNETITSTPSTTTSNSATNNKKTKYSYQSINKNFNQFFTNSHQATASSSPSSASSSATFHHSAMMPSVASRLKKNIARTKEKFLQNIGKTDRTNDESFDLYVENFEKQHSQASRLTKELNKYVNCLKETQKSSRLFYEILRDTYEPNWPGSNEFAEQIQLMEIKWNDYLSKLINEVQSPLIAYLNEFPELKKKIEKRDNRLLDYDNARHTLEAAQHKSTKKQLQQQQQQNNTLNNSNVQQTGTTMTSGGSSSTSSSATDQLTKLTKLKIELEDKQQNYEEMNQTLCMSLPVLYENRIKFYSSLFQTFFHTETIFHSDCLEVESKLDDLCESLCTTTAQQVPSPQKLFQQKQEQLRLLQQQKDLLNTFSYYFQKNIIKFKVFNLKSLCKTTILFKNHSICSTKMNFMDFDSVSLSDFVRFFVLEQYQGIYSDGDVFYLRNMKILWLTNFVYRWSFTNGINTAVVGLNKHLNPSIEILYKTIIKQVKSSHALTSSFHPSEISQYMLNLNKNSIYDFKPLKTMHSFLFDPAWVCFDGVSPAFNSKSICNFIDLTKKQFINETDFRIDQFFPGAFSYHIHLKDARPDFISSKSYFVYFENYFKSVLKLK